MNRKKHLLRKRESILTSISYDKENKAKWVAELLDIDHEIERYSTNDNQNRINQYSKLKQGFSRIN